MIIGKFEEAIQKEDILEIERILKIWPERETLKILGLSYAAKHNLIEMVRLLLDPKGRIDALRWAIKNKNIEIIDCLIDNDSYHIKKVVETASEAGDLDILKYIISKVGDVDYNMILFCAANSGHLDIVEFSMPFVENNIDKITSLAVAIQNNFLEVVKFIVHNTNTSKLTDTAITLAAYSNKKKIIDYLFDLCDVDDLKLKIDDSRRAGDGIDYFMCKYEAYKTKEILKIEIQSYNHKNKKKSII